jgi:YD repeat-containing protein
MPQGSQTSGYDDAGHRTSLTGTGISRSWTYDDAGRLLTTTNEQSEVTTDLYDSAGRLSRTTFANGQVTNYGYDARSRLTSLNHKTGPTGTLISYENYGLDAAGNLFSRTIDGTYTSYAYDSADRLTIENGVGYTSSYTYDANGNRTSKTLNGVTDTYAVDDGDKLTSVPQGATTIKSYTYDTAGRTKTVVSSAGTTSLNYDYESRVTSVVYPSSATNTFSYNGLDTRVSKVDSAGTATYRRDGADVTDDVLPDGGAVYTPGISQRRGTATTYDLSDRLVTATRQAEALPSPRRLALEEGPPKVYGGGFNALVAARHAPLSATVRASGLRKSSHSKTTICRPNSPICKAKTPIYPPRSPNLPHPSL